MIRGMVYCFQSRGLFSFVSVDLGGWWWPRFWSRCGKMFWWLLFCRTGVNVLCRTWLTGCLCQRLLASETQRWFLWLQEAGWTWSDPLTQPTTFPPESAKLAVRISTGRVLLPVKVVPRYQVLFQMWHFYASIWLPTLTQAFTCPRFPLGLVGPIRCLLAALSVWCN